MAHCPAVGIESSQVSVSSLDASVRGSIYVSKALVDMSLLAATFAGFFNVSLSSTHTWIGDSLPAEHLPNGGDWVSFPPPLEGQASNSSSPPPPSPPPPSPSPPTRRHRRLLLVSTSSEDPSSPICNEYVEVFYNVTGFGAGTEGLIRAGIEADRLAKALLGSEHSEAKASFDWVSSILLTLSR